MNLENHYSSKQKYIDNVTCCSLFETPSEPTNCLWSLSLFWNQPERSVLCPVIRGTCITTVRLGLFSALWTAANTKAQTSNQGSWQSRRSQWQRSNWQSLPAAGLNQSCRYATRENHYFSFSKENKRQRGKKSTLSYSDMIKRSGVPLSWMKCLLFVHEEAEKQK